MKISVNLFFSRMTEYGYYRKKETYLPVKWSAPEVLELDNIQARVMFGLLESFSGNCSHLEKFLIQGMSNEETAQKVISGYRLSPPTEKEGCPRQMADLMHAC